LHKLQRIIFVFVGVDIGVSFGVLSVSAVAVVVVAIVAVRFACTNCWCGRCAASVTVFVCRVPYIRAMMVVAGAVVVVVGCGQQRSGHAVQEVLPWKSNVRPGVHDKRPEVEWER
jgi:hypothetical protein